MNAHADKAHENKSRSVANEVSQKQRDDASTFQFVDNRPAAIAQRKLHKMANDSPQVQLLKDFQTMTNHSPQVTNTIQMRTIVQGGAYDITGTATRDPEDSPQVIGPIGVGGGKRPPNRNLKGLLGHGVDMNPDVDAEEVVPAFRVNERPGNEQGTWSVFEVHPGIGVEVMKGQDRGYVDFVAEQLRIILNTTLGQNTLDQFNPLTGGREFRMVINQEGPYRGLTVVISNPSPFKSVKFGRQPSRQIRTQNFSGRTERGKKQFDGTRIPIIDFFNRPQPDQSDPIIDEGKETETLITERGVEGHPDFPEDVQPFDIVLYHELRHAILDQTGISDALHKYARSDTADKIEEQLVVGLRYGKGLAGSENDYRTERGDVPLRTSYRAVGIEDDQEVNQIRWPSQGGEVVTIDQALELAGLGKRFTENNIKRNQPQ